MLSKKSKSVCPIARVKKAPQRKKSGEKVSKTFDLNCADELTANNKGSSFGQEKLLALDEGDL